MLGRVLPVKSDFVQFVLRAFRSHSVHFWLASALAWLVGLPVWAQLDPTPRRVLQLGYNQPTEGKAPFAAYAFYYYNQPGFYRTNWTLRAAIAPVYADAELGFLGGLGGHTDLGVGLAGGGFADSYSEIRGGRWIQAESFTGHAGEFSLSAYHLLNPLASGVTPTTVLEAPAQLVFRGALRYSQFERNDATANDFVIPEDRPTGHVRVGIRWGGREPLMVPPVAFELSAWYEGQFRANTEDYGYHGSTPAASQSHRFWARALLAYTLPSQQRFEVILTAGSSLNADRLSAYRLGGTLPLAAEFPLMIPGYYFEEISTRQFALFNANYSVPLGKHWEVLTFGAAAVCDYLPGLEQRGNLNAGVGAGFGWETADGGLHIVASYAYGVNALRGDERGAHNVGILIQYDFERGNGVERARSVLSRLNPTGWRGVNGLFHR